MTTARREWGAALFVATVFIGAIAVAVSLLISGSKAAPAATLPPCPIATAQPSASPGASPTAPVSTTSSATVGDLFKYCPTPAPSTTPAPSPGAAPSAPAPVPAAPPSLPANPTPIP